MTELEQRANDEARHAHRELIETLTERADTAEAERDDQIEWVRSLADDLIAAEARLAEAVEGLTEIERLHYQEGKDASWRAAHMNGVARDTINNINAWKQRATLAKIKGETNDE